MRRLPLLSGLLSFPLLSLVAGCGGETVIDDPVAVPVGIARFTRSSSDFNGDSSDLITTVGQFTVVGASYIVQVSRNGRMLEIVMPAAPGEVGSVVRFDGSNPNAVARYSYNTVSPVEQRKWQSSGGTVTVLARDANSATVRLNDLRFAPNTANFPTSDGTFTLNGTVQGVQIEE